MTCTGNKQWDRRHAAHGAEDKEIVVGSHVAVVAVAGVVWDMEAVVAAAAGSRRPRHSARIEER